MAIAIDVANVAQYQGSADETSHAVAVTTAPASGSLVIVCVGANKNASVLSSVTDSKGNTYSVDSTRSTASGVAVSIASSVLTTPLTTSDTITVNIPSATMTVQAFSFTGSVTSSYLDQTGNAEGTSGSTPSATTASTLAGSDDLSIAATACTGTPTTTAGAFYTSIVNDLSSTGSFIRRLSVEYRIGVGTAAETATFNYAAPSVNWGEAIATYKALAIPPVTPSVAWLTA